MSGIFLTAWCVCLTNCSHLLTLLIVWCVMEYSYAPLCCEWSSVVTLILLLSIIYDVPRIVVSSFVISMDVWCGLFDQLSHLVNTSGYVTWEAVQLVLSVWNILWLSNVVVIRCGLPGWGSYIIASVSFTVMYSLTVCWDYLLSICLIWLAWPMISYKIPKVKYYLLFKLWLSVWIVLFLLINLCTVPIAGVACLTGDPMAL